MHPVRDKECVALGLPVAIATSKGRQRVEPVLIRVVWNLKVVLAQLADESELVGRIRIDVEDTIRIRLTVFCIVKNLANGCFRPKFVRLPLTLA